MSNLRDRIVTGASRGLPAMPGTIDDTADGTVQLVGELAREYGFTDVDGRVIPPFEMQS
jgi:hypothetical protein